MENYIAESERELIQKNKTELSGILDGYQKSCDVWGHGVETLDTAENILSEGLRTSWGALHDIAYQIPENPINRIRRFEGWDYNGRTTIVLIASPKGLEFSDVGINGGIVRDKSLQNSADHIFAKPKGPKNIIPPENIIGYVDANTYKFIENPSFKEKMK